MAASRTTRYVGPSVLLLLVQLSIVVVVVGGLPATSQLPSGMLVVTGSASLNTTEAQLIRSILVARANQELLKNANRTVALLDPVTFTGTARESSQGIFGSPLTNSVASFSVADMADRESRLALFTMSTADKLSAIRTEIAAAAPRLTVVEVSPDLYDSTEADSYTASCQMQPHTTGTLSCSLAIAEFGDLASIAASPAERAVLLGYRVELPGRPLGTGSSIQPEALVFDPIAATNTNTGCTASANGNISHSSSGCPAGSVGAVCNNRVTKELTSSFSLTPIFTIGSSVAASCVEGNGAMVVTLQVLRLAQTAAGSGSTARSTVTIPTTAERWELTRTVPVGVTWVATLLATVIALLLHLRGSVVARSFMVVAAVAIAVAAATLTGRWDDEAGASTSSRTFSHFIHFDEYPSDQCGDSQSPLPVRTSRFPADRQCHRVQTVGSSEGPVYAVGACTGTGPRILAASTLAECQKVAGTVNSASVLTTGTCFKESIVMAWKPPVELHHLVASCWNATASQSRWEVTLTQPRNVSSEVAEVIAVPTAASFQESSTPLRFFRGVTPQSTLRLVGVTGKLSLVSSIYDSSIPIDSIDRRAAVTLNNAEPASTKVYTGIERMSNLGVLFNGADDGNARRDAVDLSASLRFGPIAGTSLDLGLHDTADGATLTFWLRVDSTTRGFAFVAADHRVYRDSGDLVGLNAVVEDLLSDSSSSSGEGRIYYGLYVDGLRGTVSWVAEDNDGQVAVVQQWSNVNSIFSGRWSYLSLVFRQERDRVGGRLFINGQPAGKKNGFADSCSPEGWSHAAVRGSPPAVPSALSGSQVAFSGGVLLVGRFNGGVYDLQFHTEALSEATMAAIGTELLPDGTNGGGAGTTWFAFFVIGFVGVLAMLSLTLLALGVWRNRRIAEGLSDDDDDEDGPTVIRASEGRRFSTKPEDPRRRTDPTKSSAARRARGPTSVSSLLLAIIPAVQLLGLIVQEIEWPASFAQLALTGAQAVLFDLNLLAPSLVDLDVALVVILGLLLTLMVGMACIALRDNDRFSKMLERRGAAALQNNDDVEDPAADVADAALICATATTPKMRLHFTLSSGHEIATEIEDNRVTYALLRLWKELVKRVPVDLTTPAETNAVKSIQLSHPRKWWEPAADYVVESIAMYRVSESSEHVKVIMSMRPASKPGAEMEKVKLTCTPTETIGRCVEHGRTLIRAQPAHHRVRKSGARPYQCAHHTTHGGEGTMLAMLGASKKIPACPMNGIDDEQEFFVCRDEACGFALCSCCAKAHIGCYRRTRISIATVGYAAAHSPRLYWASSALFFAAEVLLLPCVWAATVFLGCSERLRCAFPGGCFDNDSNRTSEFIVNAAIAVATCAATLAALALVLLAMLKRSRLIRLHRSECFNDRDTVGSKAWQAILNKDTTLLRAAYEAFDYDRIHALPVVWVIRCLPIVGLAATETNSFTQCIIVTSLILIQILQGVVSDPYSDAWVAFLHRVSGMYVAGLLGLLALHRGVNATTPENTGYANWMLLATMVYGGVIVLVFVFSVLVPCVRLCCRARKAGPGVAKSAAAQNGTIGDGEMPSSTVMVGPSDGADGFDVEDDSPKAGPTPSWRRSSSKIRVLSRVSSGAKQAW